MPPPGLLLFLLAALFHLNLFKLLLPPRFLQRRLPLRLLFASFGLLGLPAQTQQRIVLRRCA